MINTVIEILKNNKDLWIAATITGCFALLVSIINSVFLYFQNKKQHKLDKQFEKYKAGVENKVYITRTKFDTEFSIYRALSVAFFDMVKNISIMIPEGYSQVPADPKAKKEYDKKIYNNALTSVVKAQDTLNGNAPFISKDMYNEYSVILRLCNQQLKVFNNRWNVLYLASQEEKETLDFEDYKRTETINELMMKLNDKVRKYISRLDVIE